MKSTKIVVIATAVMMLVAACAENGSSPLETNVAVDYQITNAEVRDNISDGAPGSLTVTSVRMLASQLKLHINGMPANEEYRLMKVGPLAFLGYPTSSTLVTLANMISDEYDEVKFEIHRFQPNELSKYSSDTAFAVFATPERFSFVIEGVIDGSQNFTYRTDVVANVQLPFSSAIVVHPQRLTDIHIQFDAAAAFISGNAIIDPRNPANKILLDYQIRSALKAAQ